MAKKLMYVHRRAPHGSIYEHESLEVVLVGAAFEQDVSLAFIDDGVFQLLAGQDTSDIEVKNFTPAYGALGDYDVNRLYVERESLVERGVAEADLLALTYEDEDDDWAEKASVRVVGRDELARLMDEQDVIFTF